MKRRDLLGIGTGTALPMVRAMPSGTKTLRTAFNFAETGFDPAQVSDVSSNTVNAHIFESPRTYDYLARPVRLRPQTAVAALDRLYERQRALPDGPERLAAMREATRLMPAYQPYIAHHRIVTDLAQARVRGYRRHPFTRDWWRYADIA